MQSTIGVGQSYTSPTSSDIQSFFKGPFAHCKAKFGPEVGLQAARLSIFALFIFLWELIVLFYVPGAVVLIGLGHIAGACYAMGGYIGYFTQIWYTIWLAIDLVLVVLTSFRGAFSGDHALGSMILISGWTGGDLMAFVLARKLKAMTNPDFNVPTKI